MIHCCWFTFNIILFHGFNYQDQISTRFSYFILNLNYRALTIIIPLWVETVLEEGVLARLCEMNSVVGINSCNKLLKVMFKKELVKKL